MTGQWDAADCMMYVTRMSHARRNCAVNFEADKDNKHSKNDILQVLTVGVEPTPSGITPAY